MNKVNEMLEELDLKVDRLKQKVKGCKVICKNNTEGSSQLVFAHNVYGTNKVLTYDITVLGTSMANIVVKLDGVVLTATNGLTIAGEILLKAHKLYSLSVECTGDGILAGKLRLEGADLRII